MITTVSTRPDSICADPTDSADRNPVQAAPRSNVPARVAPRSWATSGAAPGMISSAVDVATITSSTSSALTPARSSA